MFAFRAPGCEFVRVAIKGELWNEATNGIVSRVPGARNMMDSKGLARWRGLVRVTPENCWMRETTTEGRFAEFFRTRRGGVGCGDGLRVNLRPASSR